MFVLCLAEVVKAAYINPQLINFQLSLTTKQIFASQCAGKDLSFSQHNKVGLQWQKFDSKAIFNNKTTS